MAQCLLSLYGPWLPEQCKKKFCQATCVHLLPLTEHTTTSQNIYPRKELKVNEQSERISVMKKKTNNCFEKRQFRKYLQISLISAPRALSLHAAKVTVLSLWNLMQWSNFSIALQIKPLLSHAVCSFSLQ